MRILIARAARAALDVMINLYTSGEFQLDDQDQKDLEKMREYKSFLDGKIVELLNK